MSEAEAAPANVDPNKKDPNADLYESKGSKKLIRLVTVVAYMFSVSFVAIVLSAYYLFLWVPPDPKLLRRPVHLSGDPELQFLVGDSPSDEIPLSGTRKFGGRIADDNDDPKSRLNKRHQSLNESLLMLRMFLTEQQRKLRHDSAASNSGKLENKTRTEETLLVANSTTIFADKLNEQGFTKGIEHIPVSPWTKTTAAVEETGTNVTETEIWPAKIAKNYRSNSIQEELSNTVGIVALIDRSEVLATNGKESSLDRLAINASRNWKFTDRLESNSPFRAIAHIAMNSKDVWRGTRRIMQLPRKMSAQNLNPEKSNSETDSREHKASNEIRFAGDERKDKLYEPKHKQKLVRVLTVVAYVIFVSMGAILLSLYYTFVWDPKDVTTPRIRPQPECVNTKLPNPLTTPSSFNGTQVDKVTVRSVSNESKRTEEPEVATTTLGTASQPKNLLTILTTTATSSSDLTELTPQDFTTNPNTETRESLTSYTSPEND